MGPKKGKDNRKEKRKMTGIMIEAKKKIVSEHGNNVRVSDFSTQFSMVKSRLCSDYKKIKKRSKERKAREEKATDDWRSREIATYLYKRENLSWWQGFWGRVLIVKKQGDC